MKRTLNRRSSEVVTVIVLGTAGSIVAQERPFSQAGTGQPPGAPAKAVATPAATATDATPPGVEDSSSSEASWPDRFFNGKLPDAIAKGKFHINARLRYEYADQDGIAGIIDASHAPTIRTRFGFTTAPLYGFQAMIEGEDLRALGPEGNFNAAGSNDRDYKAAVPDPPTTELNQAWLSYSYTNLFDVKVGRQRIVLDNHRFIGDVGWRQNMQTFDAAALHVQPLENLDLYYAYIWDVHRVFGDVSGLPDASPFHDFQSSSHVIHLAYDICPHARLVGYSYLLDLDLNNGTAAANNSSSATYGGYVAGSAPLRDRFALAYRAEFAWQTDHADSSLEYDALYYNLELSANVRPFAFGAGYEVLGSGENDGAGGGRAAFRTPLSTLHAFNGWADVFSNTPNNGLRDLYAFAQVTLPKQIPLRFVYHKYDADSGSDDFGHEFNVMASRKFGRNWTALVKYACYMGDDAAPPALSSEDVEAHKFWAQVEFNF